MQTNIDIDDKKVKAIMKMKNFKTKKEAVNAAIDDYFKKITRLEILKWKGSNFWEGDLDEMRLD